jgi:alginate O-acetyltransferase complex protein AlgI
VIFSTYWFLCASSIFLVLYAISEPKLRVILLLLFCVIFHTHFAGAAGVMPIVCLGAVTYVLARSNDKRAQTLGIILCCLALTFYKYSHFICRELLGVFGKAQAQQLDAWLDKLLPATAPLAISFFVFEFVHYLWDRRHGKPVIEKPVDFIQFALFFPSLVAGPIKRYEQFLPSLTIGTKCTSGLDFSQGLTQVAAGFFKKIVLADNLTLYINSATQEFHAISQHERWIFLIALSLRIYFDFSGYSDIAIGVARMMGINLPINFNWPYTARNIQDFWQRWHISLSSWIRDYVYIPLGGSRRGTLRTVANGVFAFALCGLWHGAAWNFLCWGLYHGFGLAVASNYRDFLGKLGRSVGWIFDRIPFSARATTFGFVSFGWLLFFYPLAQAFEMCKLLFSSTTVQ